MGVLVHRDRVEGERWREAERAKVASREAIFARGQLGEMLEFCREGWSGELLPAETPPEAETKAEGEWPGAHGVAASRSLSEGDLALQAK